MAPLKQFAIPADVVDLTGSEQKELNREWSENVRRWTEISILGDPWTSLHDHDRIYYYNPLKTDVATGVSAPIAWTAFPNRILLNFPTATFDQQMGYAEGVHDDGTFGPPPDVGGQPYRPTGPRGWQDEYCEWISTRDMSGKITTVDFTCENPDYWYALWNVSPQRVLALYRQLVDPAVQLKDLFLRDAKNKPVIDRATGFAAYNALNKWNNQPSAGQKTGAAHLISPPNTLFAEIYLGAAGTLLRQKGGTPVTDPDELIRCSQYGAPGRNSDPHIGSEVNKIIAGGGVVASLQDPVGLYLQTPDFSGYSLPADPKLPADADVAECWNVMRGRKKGAGDNIDFILHARFEIPKRWKDAGVSFTVGDIQLNGNPIRFGAQITQTFQVALRGFAVKTSLPPEPLQPCVEDNPTPLPRPVAVRDLNLLNAGSVTEAATFVEQGKKVKNVALVAINVSKKTKVSFGPGVKATVTDFQSGPLSVLTLTLDVDKNAALGDRAVQLTNDDGSHGPAAPGLLSIVRHGTLGVNVAAESAAALEDEDAAAPAEPSADAMEAALTRLLQKRR